MTSKLDPQKVTLARARRYVQKRIDSARGVKCPCCRRIAHVRRGHITPSMVTQLVKIYSISPRAPFQLKKVLIRDQNGDYAKLRYWGLLEQVDLGWWRLTARGRAFVRGEVEVPRTALTYNRRLIRLCDEPVSVVDCLGERSAYDALLAKHRVARKP